MKKSLYLVAIALILQSCITINVYQTEDPEVTESAPTFKMKKMLPMGKSISLDGNSHELFFFDEDKSNHFELFVNDSMGTEDVKVKKIRIKTRMEKDTLVNSWTPKSDKASVFVFRSDSDEAGKEPLIILDGKRIESGTTSLDEMNPDEIDTINVLKGEAAIKKYGPDAANGVVEIKTKEN